VALWLAELAQEGKKATTIERHLAALASLAKSAGLENPADSPLVKAVLRGIRRTSKSRTKQAKPFLFLDLIAGLPTGDTLKALRDRAILLLGWTGALRRSELVALNLEDIEERPEGVIIQLRRSKTDQTAKGRQLAIPYAIGNICPVKALNQWRSRYTVNLASSCNAPVFCSINRHSQLKGRLEDRAVDRLVKEAAHRAGLEEGYSAHSLRAGFISEAALRGKSERSIAQQSGHKSLPVLRGYIRRATPFQDNAVVGLI
jgi:integrase